MTVPTQHQAPSADDFLMGGGVTSAKFPVIGTTISGRITERPTVEQQKDFTTGEPKFWEDGKPQMQLVVTLATNEIDPANPDDDGSRRVYVKGQMKNAVAQAVRTAGARGLEVGGILSVTYSMDGIAKNPRFNAPKNFTAQYTPAATVALNTPDPGTGLTAQQQQAAAQNPATAALLAQQQAAQAASTTTPPPF